MFDFPASARPVHHVLLPAALAGVLMLSGCGGESGPSPEELETMIAPDDTSGNAAHDPEISELQFDPESVICEPHANSSVSGEWETSAPRETVSPGEETELGLRDTEASAELNVVARILTPSENQFEAETPVSGGEWANLSFPADFPEAPGSVITEGVYTVVWSAGDDGEDEGAFISCDGFRIA